VGSVVVAPWATPEGREATASLWPTAREANQGKGQAAEQEEQRELCALQGLSVAAIALVVRFLYLGFRRQQEEMAKMANPDATVNRVRMVARVRW